MLIAVLEDDPEVGAVIKKRLHDANHEVAVFAAGAQLLAYKTLREIVLFFPDWRRPVSELSSTIDTHVSHIRKKLNLAPENGYRLQPVYNAGYRLAQVLAGPFHAA